jgi:glycosyltransferase involved in cell wall biosynthesis
LKRIAAITPGKNVPSSRFRVRQYIEDLRKNQIIVNEFPAKIYDDKMPGITGNIRQRYIFPISGSYEILKMLTRLPETFITHKFDATWLNRILLNSIHIEYFLKKPLLFDIDDAIWINNEKSVSKISKLANVVIAGNDYIATWANTCNKNVVIIPTAIDIHKYVKKESVVSNSFNIGWSGTHDNLEYLYQIEEALDRFIRKYSDVKLIILSNKRPSFKKISIKHIEWVEWNPQNEIETIQRFTVGLMPLEDTDWAKGKCSFKMLQYMSTSIPVIVSPVGMNIEVLGKGNVGFSASNLDDWYAALDECYLHPELVNCLGKNGRKVIEGNYSHEIITPKLVKVFNSIL